MGRTLHNRPILNVYGEISLYVVDLLTLGVLPGPGHLLGPWCILHPSARLLGIEEDH